MPDQGEPVDVLKNQNTEATAKYLLGVRADAAARIEKNEDYTNHSPSGDLTRLARLPARENFTIESIPGDDSLAKDRLVEEWVDTMGGEPVQVKRSYYLGGGGSRGIGVGFMRVEVGPTVKLEIHKNGEDNSVYLDQEVLLGKADENDLVIYTQASPEGKAKAGMSYSPVTESYLATNDNNVERRTKVQGGKLVVDVELIKSPRGSMAHDRLKAV